MQTFVCDAVRTPNGCYGGALAQMPTDDLPVAPLVALRERSAEADGSDLHRVLDALEVSPLIIASATWDIIAWNRATAVLLTDYSKLPREQRNFLHLMFGGPYVRAAQEDWRSAARFVVAAFRTTARMLSRPPLRTHGTCGLVECDADR
jgi:hypothetical protein